MGKEFDMIQYGNGGKVIETMGQHVINSSNGALLGYGNLKFGESNFSTNV